MLFIVSIGFILLFAALFYYNQKQESEFHKSSSIDLEREINAIVDLNAYGYTSLISEITYWDEFVNFVENKDIAWFNNSLTYLVDTYKADYIDVYNINNEFVAKASSTVINTKDFIPKEVFPILYKEKNIKFYVKIPEGIAFVFGATIHPSEDPYKNKFST